MQIIARLTYRQWYEQSTGETLVSVRTVRVRWGLAHLAPAYGVIYDEGEVIKRGTHTSSAQRAGS